MALSTQDITKGLDFTGLLTANASQHNQLVDLSVPTSDSATEGKGLVLWTVDSALDTPVVPNVAVTTKWKRYLWLRVPFAGAAVKTPILYGWNDDNSSIATYLKWRSLAADLTDILATIAAMQIEIDNVEVVANAAQATAAAAFSAANTALHVGNEALSDATLALDLISALQTDPIPTTRIEPGTANQILQTNADATAVGWVTKLIAQLAEPSGANSLNLIRVNAAGTGYELISPAQAGSSILQVVAIDGTNDTSTTIIPADGTVPEITDGKQYLAQAITPLLASSLIRVRFTSTLALGDSAAIGVVALFRGSILLQTIFVNSDNLPAGPLVLEFYEASPGAAAAVTYSIRYGPTAAYTLYMNRTVGSATPFGAGSVKGFLTIEEIAGTLN